MRIGAIVVVMAAVVFAAQAGAATWFVSPCGQDAWAGVQGACAPPLGPKRTIQSAIDVAGHGDTIVVLPGFYLETIDLDGKAVHLLAQGGPAVTTINGGGAGPVISCNSLEGSDTVIQGFTVSGGGAQQGGGMLCALSTPTVMGCVFENNNATHGGGAVASLAASPTFIGCDFIDNNASSFGVFASGGAVLCELGSPEFYGCEFISNGASGSGGAVYIGVNTAVVIDETDFSLNGATLTLATPASGIGGALHVDGGELELYDAECDDNYAWGPGGALSVTGGGVAQVSTSSFESNESIAHRGGAVAVEDSELSIIGASFHLNSVTSPVDSDRGGGALFAEDSVVEIAWSAFIENYALDFGGADGGAICTIDSDLTVENTTLNDNESGYSGGAIAAKGVAGQFVMTGSSLASNEAFNGGGVRVWQASAEIVDCEIEGNHAVNAGGGISASFNSEVLLRDSMIAANSCDGTGGGLSVGSLTRAVACDFIANTAARGGGAASLGGSGEAVYIGCLFQSNSASDAGGAIGVTTNSDARIINTLIIGNFAPINGGAVHTRTPDYEGGGSEMLDIFNSTIAHNVGGGVLIENNPANTSVYNSIVWGNSFGDAFIGGDPTVWHSNIEGGAPGVENIDSDPLFVDPPSADYRLAAGSPCIDAGLNTAIPQDEADLDADALTAELTPYDHAGEARVMSVAGCSGEVWVDMGAFEAPGLTVITAGDLDGNGVVDSADLAILLSTWGPCAGCCPGDYNGDGAVDSADLAILLAAWG